MRRSLLHSSGRLFRVTLFMILPFLFSCANPVRSHPKSVMMDGNGAYFAGRWITADMRVNIIPKVNNTNCNCNRSSMKCREVTAMLYNATLPSEYLDAEEINYDVIEWSESHIRGVAELPVVDIEIRISLPDQKVEKTYKKPVAAGSDHPEFSKSYILE